MLGFGLDRPLCEELVGHSTNESTVKRSGRLQPTPADIA
jgi:hypothetical protein